MPYVQIGLDVTSLPLAPKKNTFHWFPITLSCAGFVVASFSGTLIARYVSGARLDGCVIV